jgi:hypothetical protein
MIQETTINKKRSTLYYKFFNSIQDLCDWFNENPQYEFINFDKVSDSIYNKNYCAVYKEYI